MDLEVVVEKTATEEGVVREEVVVVVVEMEVVVASVEDGERKILRTNYPLRK